jgi:ribosomal protein S27AE
MDTKFFLLLPARGLFYEAINVAVVKAMNIACSECGFVALVIQHAIRMRHIVICGLHGSTTFLHIISQTARFGWGE